MYTYFKLAVIWLKKDKILALLDYLHREEFKPKEPEHMEIIRRSINTARSVMTYYSSMCVGAVSVGILMPLAENFKILPTNVEYPFFSVYESPAYEILYVHHGGRSQGSSPPWVRSVPGYGFLYATHYIHLRGVNPDLHDTLGANAPPYSAVVRWSAEFKRERTSPKTTLARVVQQQ
ncbi:hypothetical protein EVAR_81363_1 [Eumeta japonica]|uniref:Uncharacterized protein n=1 Tax=Eumeta variegata TaxID=151549 RepID=A0A4C1X8X0_EUMVA|nr:hypothetical protein EVAR_81363_1 [Eumeta japonica]